MYRCLDAHCMGALRGYQILMCVARCGFPRLYRALMRALRSLGTMYTVGLHSVRQLAPLGLIGAWSASCHAPVMVQTLCSRPNRRCEHVATMV